MLAKTHHNIIQSLTNAPFPKWSLRIKSPIWLGGLWLASKCSRTFSLKITGQIVFIEFVKTLMSHATIPLIRI